ncbi:mitochondrial mRNA pseudouridine synthase RPUSD3 isoform X1 [Ambystoma mexicanum]|uniref:mitochondrial mRNA pseudouridine synthase RPUSD3 isoform X1 n=1 Tax=Ambystoma mexicanum TaxID=8296 RepID=UPI0037E8D414
MNHCAKYFPAAKKTWVDLERCLRPTFCLCGTMQFTTRTSTTLARSRAKLQPQKRSAIPLVAGATEVSILRDPGVVTPEKLTKEALVELLVANVEYRKGVLVAISKPPGIPITGTESDVTLVSLLPRLGSRLGIKEELHVVKAATKESSGLVLLSTCHTTTKGLEDFFVMARRRKKPVFTYCAVVIGIPDPEAGDIFGYLKLENIRGHNLVVVEKDPSRSNIESRDVKKTQTYYKVLDSSEGCALVQLQPMSAFQSQLQVHATLKLAPILGDHVYSARVGKVLGQPIFLPPEDALPRTQERNRKRQLEKISWNKSSTGWGASLSVQRKKEEGLRSCWRL